MGTAVTIMLLSKGLRVPKVHGTQRLRAAVPGRKRQSEGERLLEAVSPVGGNRKSGSQAVTPLRRVEARQQPESQRLLEAAFGQRPNRKKTAFRPGAGVGIGLPVKLHERHGGGVEAVLRREIAHAGELSARDFGRLRSLLGRAEMVAKMQSPRGSGRHRVLQKRLAAAWGTRLERDAQGVRLVLENRSGHAVYLAKGTKHIRPRAVFKGALAAQQEAIDAEWQRLARLAQMRHETRGQIANGTQSQRQR